MPEVPRKPVPLAHWWQGCLVSGLQKTPAEGGIQLQERQSGQGGAALSGLGMSVHVHLCTDLVNC